MNLIQQAKSKPDAFCELYKLHLEPIYQFIFFRVKSREIAEDLTSSTWEKILKGIVSFKSNNEAAFRAWIFQIARNTVFEHYRQKNELPLNEEALAIKSEEALPSQEVQTKENSEEIRCLIEALPDAQKEIVIMKFFSDLKNKEIAKILEISEKTVASNLSRALATLELRFKKLQ
jgi:RNA polymerase sigma-70 factor (ECF subfamily)